VTSGSRLILAALAWLLCLSISIVAHPAAARRSRRDRPSTAPRRALNMPPGWTWPPSAAMAADGRRCLDRLDRLGVAWEEGPPKRKVATPVVVPDMDFAGLKVRPLYGTPPYVIDCHLAETLAAAAAPALKAAGVTELRVSSLHEYRTVRGRRILSRHAVGLAVDIFEFVTEDGAVRRVKGAYWAKDGLLRRIERRLKETGLFRGPLTPGNDRRGHHDHFHLEARTPPERRPDETPNA
jgi:hypothetical protein